MNDKEHIESFIRKSLDQLEVQPSIPSFELTMKKLEAAQKEKRKKRFFIWFFAGIAGLGISSLALFYPYGKMNDYLQTNSNIKQETKQLNSAFAQKPENTNYQEQSNTATNTDNVKKTNEATAKRTNTIISASAITPAYTTPAPTAVIPDKPLSAQQTMNEQETAWSYLALNKTNDLNTLYSEDTTLRNAALTKEKTQEEDTTKKKKNVVWYAGAGFTPQWTLYSLHTAKNADSKYTSFSNEYHTARLDAAKPVLNYQAALRSGLVYKEKWMLLFGLGYQVFTYKESVSYISVDTTSGSQPPPVITFTPTGVTSGPTPGSNGTYYSTSNSESITFNNTFRYAQLSAAVSRLFRLKHFGLNAGVGFSVSHLLPSNVLTVEDKNAYSYRYRSSDKPMSAWTCTSQAHFGMMKQIGKRVLVQAGPNAFYNLSPMFRKGYIIDQKPYGLGFDLNLLIRLN